MELCPLNDIEDQDCGQDGGKINVINCCQTGSVIPIVAFMRMRLLIIGGIFERSSYIRSVRQCLESEYD